MKTFFEDKGDMAAFMMTIGLVAVLFFTGSLVVAGIWFFIWLVVLVTA